MNEEALITGKTAGTKPSTKCAEKKIPPQHKHWPMAIGGVASALPTVKKKRSGVEATQKKLETKQGRRLSERDNSHRRMMGYNHETRKKKDPSRQSAAEVG